MKRIIILLVLFIGNSYLFAQREDLKINIGEYTFLTKYDTSTFISTLTIEKENRIIFTDKSDYSIMDIKEYDLNNDGNNEILIDLYSGGAHCCTFLVAARMINDRFTILDSIYWGNSFYAIHDFNGDGKKEILGASDMFAYAFTNFAQSEFNVLIYTFENNTFQDVTKNFPKIIEEDIEDHIEELKSYIKDKNFMCQENDTADTFNTDAGAVKAILAPLVADYYNLGDVEKGYSFIDLIYKCPDKDRFIQILQNDFKLK